MKKNVNLFLVNKWFFQKVRENPKLKHAHAALFYWITEKANLSGWADSFYFQTDEAMASAGFSHWQTYQKALTILEQFGIINIIEKSNNQYTPCVLRPCFYEFGVAKQEHSQTRALTVIKPGNITIEALTTLKNRLINETIKLQSSFLNELILSERFNYIIQLCETTPTILDELNEALSVHNPKRNSA